eukprot:scaffold8690_cov190-Amphora_coffeaeformis.AAC.7
MIPIRLQICDTRYLVRCRLRERVERTSAAMQNASNVSWNRPQRRRSSLRIPSHWSPSVPSGRVDDASFHKLEPLAHFM